MRRPAVQVARGGAFLALSLAGLVARWAPRGHWSAVVPFGLSCGASLCSPEKSEKAARNLEWGLEMEMESACKCQIVAHSRGASTGERGAHFGVTFLPQSRREGDQRERARHTLCLSADARCSARRAHNKRETVQRQQQHA